jgi:hypothetical protein
MPKGYGGMKSGKGGGSGKVGYQDKGGGLGDGRQPGLGGIGSGEKCEASKGDQGGTKNDVNR